MAQALDYLIEYTDILSPAKANSPFFARHKNLSEEQIVSDLPRRRKTCGDKTRPAWGQLLQA